MLKSVDSPRYHSYAIFIAIMDGSCFILEKSSHGLDFLSLHGSDQKPHKVVSGLPFFPPIVIGAKKILHCVSTTDRTIKRLAALVFFSEK